MSRHNLSLLGILPDILVNGLPLSARSQPPAPPPPTEANSNSYFHFF